MDLRLDSQLDIGDICKRTISEAWVAGGEKSERLHHSHIGRQRTGIGLGLLVHTSKEERHITGEDIS